MSPQPPQANARFRLATGDWLDVRTFHVKEAMGKLFELELTAMHPNPDLDLEGFVGETARFELAVGRSWVGTVRSFELVQSEDNGLSTYRLVMVPSMWLLTQRRNHRVFQRMTEPDMAVLLLKEWGIPYELRIDGAAYKKRDYRVQYGESDFAFLSRMLEDAGITYWFETKGDTTRVILSDSPQTDAQRGPITYIGDPSNKREEEYVTKLSVTRELRPGKYTLRDIDFRIPPNYPLLSTSTADAKEVEADLESFHYVPGAFLFEGDGGDSPCADDKLAVRTCERQGALFAQRRLEAARSDARSYRFNTNAVDLRPGLRVAITDHARAELGPANPLLVTEIVLHGEVNSNWSLRCRATPGAVPFRSPVTTPKPKVSGVETATVVGGSGDEIHTDEYGRVRVHFHWDRQSGMNDESSCWVPVSHPWAGTGFGGMNIPRVGQEVVIDFLGGDPDKPMVIGRVYTALQQVPFKLPDNKTQSGWKSNSTTASGGYNEIMFEDEVGREEVRIQAERDMNTLVKHDETRTVENDRKKRVLNDETSDIGNNRTETVKVNETITIGGDRTETVIQNEQWTVQGNRERAVHGNEDTFIGGNFAGQVVANASQTIGANSSLLVSSNRSAQIGGSDSTSVAASRSATMGANDATTVGNSFSVSVAPGGAPLGSFHMTPAKTELTTGVGATLTLEGAKITLSADTIVLDAKNIFGAASEKLALAGGDGASMGSAKGEAKVNGKTLVLSGKSSAELTSPATTTVSGTPVQLNGPGLFAGRVTELAPATITTGAALVLVGGSSFPYEVTRNPDGSLQVGDHIVVQADPNDPEFQDKVMRDLGIMSSTETGKGLLDSLQNNPGNHDVNIRPMTAQEITDYGENNSLAYRLSNDGLRNADGTLGSGSGSDIAYNPDIVLGPNGEPRPADSTLHHELKHAEDNAYGNNRAAEELEGGWHNAEEWQTIEGGPFSENDYLNDRGYPYERSDHGNGHVPAGDPIPPPVPKGAPPPAGGGGPS